MSEVLLGQSYFLALDPRAAAGEGPYPPLGTLYAAACLRERGYDVAVFDAMLADSVTEWAQGLERERPRIAVLYEDHFNYLSKMCLLRMREAAFRMIADARARGCTVIVSSSDATDHAGRYLERGAHFVILGEGEGTLVALLDRLTSRSEAPIEGVPGLAFAGRQGVVSTGRRPNLEDLDSLPLPAWELVDVPRYRERWLRRYGRFSMNLVTSRGCPYHCNWCAKPIWGQRYHAHSPERVVAELEHLRRHYGADHVWFMDDIFGLKPGWLTRFSERVEARGLRTPFKCLSRADLLLRGSTVAELARAGCETVWIGAESGSQKILDAMEKGTRVEQVVEATERLRAAGVRVGFFLQFGYPGETREDIELTLRLVRRCRPDAIGASVSYPLPGTKFYERVRDELGERQNWVDSEDLAALYRAPFSTAFYRRLHGVLHKEFRARRLREALCSALPLKRRLRTAAGLAYHLATLPMERARMEWLARVPGAAPNDRATSATAVPPAPASAAATPR